VIGTVLPRGKQVGGLLRYLFREGLAGQRGLAADHVAPRLIAAWDGDLTTLSSPERRPPAGGMCGRWRRR
jgi:hypothetical protein